MNQHRSIAGFCVLSALLAACGSSGGTQPEPAGPAAAIAAASDTVTAGFVGSLVADSLKVRVTDAENRPVPGVTVSWSAAGSAAILPSQSLTDQAGVARAQWRLATIAGPQEVQAQTLTVNGPQVVRFHATAAPGPTAGIQLSPTGAFLGKNSTQQFTVLRVDGYGNTITDRPVAWTSSNSAVATVNPQTGLVTGVAQGTADITATSDNQHATVRVSVSASPVGVDDFATASLAAYTQFSDVPAQWAATDGVLVGSGFGQQSMMIRNDVSFADGWVEADMDRADEGGLVLRFQNAGNLYLLCIRDDSSLLGLRNLEIFRRVGGNWQIITFAANVDWPRGVKKTVRFEAVGTTLRALINGVELLRVTDPTFTTAGRIGVRYNDVPEDATADQARYDVLRWLGQ